mgnify:CR=1 FL=1|tara:strand:+ start:5479 stop:6693 length:1215 start_codon:yes stop_codon:yes gene_type:complete
MPITLETFSGSELVSGAKVDRNFTTIEEFFIEGVERGDFDSKGFDRYFLKKWTNGRLNSATVGSNPLIDVTYYSGQVWDWLVPDLIRSRPHGYLPAANLLEVAQANREDLPYELLGFPGPSYLIYDVAEEGYNITGKNFKTYADESDYDTVLGRDGVETFPQLAPHNYFPESQCWSRWITVPNGSMKIYIPDACVAHINASFSMIPGPGTSIEFVYMPGWDPHSVPAQGLIRSFKIGLFIDTNPAIKTDFPNSNANIKDPITKETASYVSFKKVQEKSIKISMRTQENIRGTQELKGGSWYNISLKYRESGTFGYVDPSSSSDFWALYCENDVPGTSAPFWPESGFNGGNAGGDLFSVKDTLLSSVNDFFWESVQLNVEFYYGRSAVSNDLSDTSNSTTPDLDY